MLFSLEGNGGEDPPGGLINSNIRWIISLENGGKCDRLGGQLTQIQI
ncbi:MAG: hypothetical protein O1I87_13860 [Cylindrospermopsis raciborskii PAMP2012]|nr:hypothetical protein [Cylindrospermopsis raciborskii PAMP2012]